MILLIGFRFLTTISLHDKERDGSLDEWKFRRAVSLGDVLVKDWTYCSAFVRDSTNPAPSISQPYTLDT